MNKKIVRYRYLECLRDRNKDRKKERVREIKLERERASVKEETQED